MMSIGSIPQPYVTLFGSAFSALSAGTNYCVSIYLPQLSSRLDLTATQSSLVAAAGNLGMYGSPSIIGLVIDRYGPRPALVASCVLLFTGWMTLRHFYDDGRVPSLGFWAVAGAQALTGIGSSCGNGGAVNGVARSFVNKRASAMTVVICCTGLSAFVYSSIYRLFLRPKKGASPSDDGTSAFLLLLALGCTISMLVGIALVHPPSKLRGVFATGAQSEAEAETAPLLGATNATKSVDEDAEVVSTHGWKMLATQDFWILFVLEGLLAGVGLMYINNLGAVIRVLDYKNPSPSSSPASQQAYLVSLLSLANASGRIAIGFASDFFLARGVRRAFWAVPVSSMFVLGTLLAMRSERVDGWSGLTIPTLVTGFAYGNVFGLLPVLTLEWFGLKSFASNNGKMVIAIAVFGQTTNYLFGRILDANSSKVGGARVCRHGRECYEPAFQLTLVMSLLALCVSVYAGWRRWSTRNREL